MKWKNASLLLLLSAALVRSRPQPISASESPFLPSSGFPPSSLVGDSSTTALTWMRGSKNISTEGGPERSSFHGP